MHDSHSVSSKPRSEPSALSPILQLFVILIPTVANSFLLVYVILGLVLTGEQHATWAVEAPMAGAYILAVVVGFCGLVVAGMYFLGKWRTPLGVVSVVQLGFALVLYVVLWMVV